MLAPILALLLTAASPFTAQLEPSVPPAAVAAPVRPLLDTHPLVVRNGGEPVLRVWFRAEIPVHATAEQLKRGVTYRQIPEGTLVGALELPKPFVDFRKQRLPAGTYTLRFAIQPDTGDHTDTAPHREFLLLTAAADDASPADIEPKRLIEESSKVNQGRHPAVLLLWPHDGTAGTSVVDKGRGVFVATMLRPVAAGERKGALGFAITIAGTRY